MSLEKDNHNNFNENKQVQTTFPPRAFTVFFFWCVHGWFRAPESLLSDVHQLVAVAVIIILI